MTLDEAIKEISEAVESHKQFKLDLSGRHIAEVLVLKSAKIGADRLAEALEVVLEELKKEKTENILTDAEKEYLSAVIKPFKDRVRFIELIRAISNHGFAWIHISVKSKISQSITGVEDFSLPYFQFGKMYNGMEVKRQYSLKELGLE